MTTPRRVLDYYARRSPMTSAGEFLPELSKLPRDVGSLVRIVQGLVIHEFVAQPMYGVRIPEERRFEAHLRSAVSLLARLRELEPRPFHAMRAPSQRVVGNCHHYAVLLLAVLRAHGIPARARWGFGAYFNPPWFEDHVCCEVWNARRSCWQLTEPQFDEQWRAQPGFPADILDVPRDRFLTASVAWAHCRAGELDADRFGIFQGNQRGYWFIAGSLVKDIAALNKSETLPWDIWDAMPAPGAKLTGQQLARFDRLAELTADPDRHFAALRQSFADEGLRVPDTVFNAVRQQAEAYA
jgi:hypothetical protein